MKNLAAFAVLIITISATNGADPFNLGLNIDPNKFNLNIKPGNVGVNIDLTHPLNNLNALNLDIIIGNKHIMDLQIQCLTGKGKCDPQGVLLKILVPEALKGCTKCPPAIKVGVDKFFRFLATNRKGDLNLLIKVFDPKGMYLNNYKKYL